MHIFAGNSDNAAYLANVCVADQARRRGVGKALVQAARCRARQWGTHAAYINTHPVSGEFLSIAVPAAFAHPTEPASDSRNV